MADQNIPKINAQKTENEKQIQEAQKELKIKRENLKKVSDAMLKQDLFKFAWDHLSVEEKKTLRENFWNLLEKLDDLWSADKNLLTQTQESFSAIVKKVETLHKEWKLTENHQESVKNLQSFQQKFNRIIEKTRELIAKIWPLEGIVDLEQNNTGKKDLELKNETEYNKDMFKLPVQSLKGFFTDEVERSLYRENDHKFMPHILTLRKSWWNLQDLYLKNSLSIDFSTDNFDDARFRNLMDDLVSNKAEGKWDSKDMADFLIESKKVIRALKARMEIKDKGEWKEGESSGSVEDQQKKNVIKVLENVGYSGDISKLKTKELIDFAKKYAEKRPTAITEAKTEQKEKLKKLRSELDEKRKERIQKTERKNYLPAEIQEATELILKNEKKIGELKEELNALDVKAEKEKKEETAKIEAERKAIKDRSEKYESEFKTSQKNYKNQVDQLNKDETQEWADKAKIGSEIRIIEDRQSKDEKDYEKTKKSLEEDLKWNDEKKKREIGAIENKFSEKKKEVQKQIDTKEGENVDLWKKIAKLNGEKDNLEKLLDPNEKTGLAKEISDLESKITEAEKEDKNIGKQEMDLSLLEIEIKKLEEIKEKGGGDDILTNNADLKALQDIEDAINKVIDGVKIDGEKGVREIKAEITKKYAELEKKQRKFKRMLLEENVSEENLSKQDEEIRKSRDELDELTSEHLGSEFNKTILNNIKLQEKDIYEELDIMIDLDEFKLKEKLQATTDLKEKMRLVNEFFKNKRVRRLRDLHDEIGHFSDPNREADYIRFMNQDNPRYQKDAEKIASFHSWVQERRIRGAFGDPLENADNVKGFWNKIAGAAGWLSTMKNKDVSGGMKVCKKTVDVLGSLGYNLTKTSFHYPTKWIGKWFGKLANNKTLQWLHKAPESKGLVGFFAKIAKAPVRLFSAPIYYSLKWAEFALTQAADLVWGEIQEGKFSQSIIDKMLTNMTDGQVNDVWNGIFRGLTESVGFVCEKGYKASKHEKKKTIAKFLKGKDLKSSIEKIDKMGDAVYARNVVKGVY